MLERRHLEELAGVIRNSCTTPEQRQFMANVLATGLVRNNPRFDAHRWVEACVREEPAHV